MQLNSDPIAPGVSPADRDKSAPSISSIFSEQNSDGGWSYRGGRSRSESTAYALLAAAAENHTTGDFQRGMSWLLSIQREDGGWPPLPSVEQSTWVTALAVLLLTDNPSQPAQERGVDWLLRQTGQETTFWHRMRMRLLGYGIPEDQAYDGWPWYPGAAAWVSPTALSVLALRRANRGGTDGRIQERIEAGQMYLMARMCRDGGWNHGSTQALGYEADSYPETTGLALLALHGVEDGRLEKSFARAEEHLRSCRFAEGVNWLRLGLLAHGRLLKDLQGEAGPCRHVVDASLSILTSAAMKGRNVFLGDA